MFKNALAITCLSLIFLAGCSKLDDNIIETNATLQEPISQEELAQTIRTSIETNGLFYWNTVSDEILWSAAMQSDSAFAIGYQPTAFEGIEEKMHEINIEDNEWTEAKNAVLDIILEEERRLRPDITVEDLLPFGQPRVLPTMTVKFTNPSIVSRLRAMDEVRYLEAMGFELPVISQTDGLRSGAGCGSAVPDYNINPADYEVIAPNVKQSWHQDPANVPAAWNTASGSGITVEVIDTGASFDQENLGSAFNSGWSQGRTVEKVSTHYTGWWWWRSLESPNDQCGHGTQMSGLATAPRGNDGNAVGVAYNSNLLAVRAVADVVISSSNEKEGVKDALILAGNRSDVKVVSMSIGTPFYSGTVADGIYYAYNTGTMLVAAAGTSTSWTNWVGVIFPASMSQTVAVTGVKDGNSLQRCDICHSGSAVDFIMVMERASDNSRHALSTAEYGNQPHYVGGSSCATASVAGIAALVWSTNPNASRQSVFNAMKENSSFYPNKNSSFGWGVPDAAAAANDL